MADTIGNSGKIPMLPVKEERRPLLKDINHCLTCFLCGGYFVNATTIIECLHTFCRSCIVTFLQTDTFCPICEVQVHRTKPYLSLRYDATMQRLVYKAVPGLYKSELTRRKKYLEGVDESNGPILNGDDSLDTDYYYSPDEPISITLEYIDRTDNNHFEATKTTDKNDNVEKEQITYRRYLQCPARLKIRHIYKFIKLKYSLRRNQEVEILYDNTKLPGSFSLMDVAYTFSWKRETPMRLYYQILESKIIQVPQTVTDKMFDASVPVKNNYVTNSNSQNSLNNAVQNSNDVQIETPRGDNFSNKLNLKRKPETNAVNSNTKAPPRENPPDLKPKEDVKVEDYELLEPSIKIPRISNTTLKDIMDSKKDGHEDKPKPTATVSPCTENGLKLPLKPVVSEDVVDDYVKYEQDIEEVEDDDDDDDDDRLRISQLSEEDTQDDKTGDTSDRQLVIDTSDFENVKEPKEEKLNGESKKSAKYKRKSKKSKHSHHHKHHRHHERKKQATPQATILHSPDTDIMKLKLKLSNVKSEVKHHRQKRKRKKSSECYFSSFSSSSSVSSASGMSPDAHGTSRVDEDSLHSHTSELSAESLDTTSFKDEPTPKITKVAEPANKYHSPTSKEKLLQMRAFRPKNVAVVKPEENHKLEKHVDKPKNDNNNNDKTIVPESKEKPKPIPTLLRPPSSITVSKITAAEKQKMEKEKLLMMNGNNDDKPSLEIMLVNGPPSSKPFTSPVSSTTDVTAKPKTPPRQIRPPPAAIPLLQYHKMKTTEQNIPKSLTITPQIQRPKSNEGVKKVKDTLSIRDSAKRSVTVSLSGNPFENDFTGALDLSGKSPRYPDMINVPQSLLNKKLCMNGVRPMPNGMSHYSPVKCMSNLADNVRPFHKTPSPNRYPMSSSPKHKISVSSPQTSPKPMSRPVAVKSKPNVPKLNEIKIGPVSSTTEIPPKPGPNQTVRHIPNPSIMLQRHQPILTSISSTNGTDYLPIKLCNPTPIMNHRVSANTCSFSTLKKNDKCPPAIPLKGYLDVSTIMATK